ncbi:hypothetical protein AHiyo8_26600 [Arthrobacter sp. Hiyo8]|nr:hypothetical protein AHiyo8_26600 [Arthrobacter sp. Hiyo8]
MNLPRQNRTLKARNAKRPGPRTGAKTRRRGDLNPRWSCAPHFISSEAHSAALARLQLLLLANQGYAELGTQCKTGTRAAVGRRHTACRTRRGPPSGAPSLRALVP